MGTNKSENIIHLIIYFQAASPGQAHRHNPRLKYSISARTVMLLLQELSTEKMLKAIFPMMTVITLAAANTDTIKHAQFMK